MRIWKREWLFWFVALVVLLGAAGVAWLTWHPSSPLIDRAAQWPVVGRLARSFAGRYRVPDVPPSSPGGPTEAGSSRTTEATENGTPESELVSRPAGARPRVWITRPTVLREGPDASSEVVARLEPVRHLPQNEKQGDWFGLEWSGGTAWAYLPNYSETADPPLGNSPEPILPLPDLAPDPRRLDEARRLLGATELLASVGSYALYTDVTDPAMIPRFQQTVPTLEGVYSKRFGVVPIGVPRAAIVVFAEEVKYEQYKLLETSLVGRRSSGHVGRGIVALYRQGRTPHEVRSTLLHELLHLLNRRAIGPALPPWLDEGIAEDLAGSEVDSRGRIEPGTLAATMEVNATGWRVTGAEAALIQLQREVATGELTPLVQLCSLDDEAFHLANRQESNYAQSGFFVRFLMARYAADFRTFVVSVSQGEAAVAERLREAVGRSWCALDEEFAAWLEE